LGTVLGSPPYMSPEQFSQRDIDLRSDVYSLAVVCYRMLTGRLPFKATEAHEWAALHMTAAPMPFEATPMGAQVPWNMKRAVLRALAKWPHERPQSMREFYSELTIGYGGRTSLLLPPPSLAPEVPGVPSSEPVETPLVPRRAARSSYAAPAPD